MMKVTIYCMRGSINDKIGVINDNSRNFSELRNIIHRELEKRQGIDYDLNTINVNIFRSNNQILSIYSEDDYRNFYINYRHSHKNGFSVYVSNPKKKSISTNSLNNNLGIPSVSSANQMVSSQNVDSKKVNSISVNDINISFNSNVQVKIQKLIDNFMAKFSTEQQENINKYLNDNLIKLLEDVQPLSRKSFIDNFIQNIDVYIRPKNLISTNIKCTKCNNYIFGKVYSCTACNNKFCDLCYSKNLYFSWDPHDFIVSFPDKSQNINVAKISKGYREYYEQVQRIEKVYEVMDRDFKVSRKYYDRDIYRAICFGEFNVIEAMKILESKKKIGLESIDDILKRYDQEKIDKKIIDK